MYNYLPLYLSLVPKFQTKIWQIYKKKKKASILKIVSNVATHNVKKKNKILNSKMQWDTELFLSVIHQDFPPYGQTSSSHMCK